MGIIWYKNVKREFWTPIASGVISVIEAAFTLSELRRNNINYSTEECSDSHRFDVIISKIVVMSAYPSISGSNFRIFFIFCFVSQYSLSRSKNLFLSSGEHWLSFVVFLSLQFRQKCQNSFWTMLAGRFGWKKIYDEVSYFGYLNI